MIEAEETIYKGEQCKAEALECLWKSQSEQLSMLKAFFIENGSVSNELKSYLQQANSCQRDAYKNFVEIQTELINMDKEMLELNKKEIKRFEIQLKEVPLKKNKISFERGTVLLSEIKDKYYSSIKECLIESGYKVQGVPFFSSYNDRKKVFEELPKDVVGFILLMNENSTYTDFKQLYFCMKHFLEKLSDFTIKKKFIMGISFQDGKFGLMNESEEVTQGSLSGLIKSLNKELKDAFTIKMLDLSRKLPADRCKMILNEELNTEDDCIEIGRDEDGRRYTLELKEKYEEEKVGIQPSKEDVFVVSGGAKGITAACIIELCRRYSCKFIILGRSELIDKEESQLAAAKTRDELIKVLLNQIAEKNISCKPSEVMYKASKILSQREIKNTIEKLNAASKRVVYCSCDILEEISVKKAIDRAKEKMGQITGFIHGAGVIRDKKIDMKTEEDFRLVYGTKSLGAKNILNAINEENLKYIIFFSSVSGYFGNAGQTDYAAANEYLNKLAFRLKQKYPQKVVMSINWGPWDAGMVSEQLKKSVEKRGRRLISIKEGIKYFMDQFTQKHDDGVCQCVIYDLNK
ncbi:SDR family NAD(P)-dependent oxidoreductase [Clostridium felsineum]|uniref:SDR family NAD(P)-dependent oxidoreductase n=1 Tax=Clostridium felsineum TaxID=36839 RepID=UPI00214D8081|nr:SDR family NAD(P)-dependent oxidoreductase [Clostridium felsineum]MCR3757617.1 SDR family NAD(P)-dependent oxidoreductase [Clostridium felsineum]